MKKLMIMVFSVVLVGFMAPGPGKCQEMTNEEIVRELRELKGRVQRLEEQLNRKDREIKELKAEVARSKEVKAEGFSGEKWADHFKLSGDIELDYSYANDSDLADTTVNDGTSDLDIGTVQLGLEIQFHEYVTGNVVIKGENLDANNNTFWDEATITIQKEGFPLYFVGGARGQPFGVFENHLISDPLTQECYEIANTGITVGYAPGPYGLDISATVYRGEVLMGQLDGFFDYIDRDPTSATFTLNPATYMATNDVSSFIGNITITPIEGLTLAAFINYEPGDDQGNETAGAALHFEYSKFTLDCEYIGAIDRERHFIDNRRYEESAFSAAIAYQVIDPLEVAIRYETFNNDVPGFQNGHLEDRYSLGLSYTLFEKGRYSSAIMAEFRTSDFEKDLTNTTDDDLDEFFLKLTFSF